MYGTRKTETCCNRRLFIDTQLVAMVAGIGPHRRPDGVAAVRASQLAPQLAQRIATLRIFKNKITLNHI